jgi:recombination associated protein RdgC
MFRNARLYRFTGPWPASEEAVSAALSAASFEPCGQFTELTLGWEAPAPEPANTLSRRVSGAELLQLRCQSRLLPAAAINEALEPRVEEFRERMGQPPTRMEQRRLKQETRDSLLPKALLRSERTRGCLLISEKVLVIDAATPNKAERFLDAMRGPLGRVEAVPLTFKRPVGNLLNRIFLGDAPPGISLGNECKMHDPSDKRASVRWVDMDLTDAGIRRHVREGMTLSHLKIEFDNVMSCVIDDNGALSKLRLMGMDAKDDSAEEEPLARFDAELVLFSGTIRNFIAALARNLGGLE